MPDAFGTGDASLIGLRSARDGEPRWRHVALPRAFFHPPRDVALSRTPSRCSRTATWASRPWRRQSAWSNTQGTSSGGLCIPRVSRPPELVPWVLDQALCRRQGLLAQVAVREHRLGVRDSATSLGG